MKERPAPGLRAAYEAACDALGRPVRKADFAFYPYVSTKSTVRERGGVLRFRISDHIDGAPEDVLRGIFAILLLRLAGARERGAPAMVRPWIQAYEDHVSSTAAEDRRSASRRARGSKHIEPVGAHRSLIESYLRVTTETGIVVPDAPALSWSKTASRRRFGHMDEAHGCIVISRVLDDPRVPEFVLDFVVYHELLHIAHPPIRGSGNKRIIHHRAFRDAEARFPRRDEAEAWLTRLARGQRP